jgi:DNA-binding CsgD family transcriptional regulator/tetratricopeptide (TPR) repeat protein
MATGAGPPLFVGRTAEIRRLNALARETAAGRGAAVLVDGEPGIGKTTLLDQVERRCADLGMRVCRGDAEDLERGLPFAAIGACLGLRTAAPAPAVARLAGLLRGDGVPLSTAAASHEFAVTEAILDLLDHWCAAGPVALIMDDAQWADPASVLALHRLAQGIAEQPLLMLIAGRALAQGETTAGLVRSLTGRRAHQLILTELSPDAVTALVARLLSARVGPRLSGLVSGAGGNPFYLTELVAALTRDGLIETAGGVAELAGAVPDAGWMPRSLVDVILQRLDFLSRDGRRTLQMAAVLGSTINVAEVADLLEVSVPALSHVVVSALDAGLLRDTGGQLEFRHDLIREVLAGHLPASVRVALHLRAGQLLAAQGAPVERVAEHLLAGTELDPRTVEWLTESADPLIVRAPHLAVSLLRRALAVVDDGGLRADLARALLWEGGLEEAERLARAELAANLGTAREGPLRWLLVQALYRQGRLADVVTVADEATAEDGRLRGFAAICLFYLERFEAGEAAAERAIELGTIGADATAAGLGNIALAAMRFAQGDMEQALEYNDRALAALGSGIQPDFQADPYAMRGYCLLELDRFAEADAILAVAARHNRQTGGVYLALVHALRARLRFLDGRWDDALAEIETGLDGPDPLNQAPGLHGLAALIAVHRGTASGELASLPEDTIGGRKYGYLVRWAQALTEESRTGPQRALDLLYPAWEQAWGLDSRRVVYQICPDLARLAALAGDDKRAEDLTRSLTTLADAQPTDGLRATVALCRGLVERDPDLLATAATLYAGIGWPLYEAQAHENAAAILAGLGRTGEARAALDRALTGYAALDAGWVAARAEARLRQAGIRRGVQGPRRRPKHGWGALTDTERRVADLVAEGRANADIAQQMFLSRRTVQTHVSSILGKLGLGSRVELAISAVRRAES